MEKKYRRFKARIKEKGNDTILTPEHWGYVTEEDCVKFWGLNNPDVEWYEIEEIQL